MIDDSTPAIWQDIFLGFFFRVFHGMKMIISKSEPLVSMIFLQLDFQSSTFFDNYIKLPVAKKIKQYDNSKLLVQKF